MGQKKHPEVKRLGNPNGAAHLRQYGGKAEANADKRAASLAATIDALRAEGVTSANGIAKALSKRSIAARRQVDGAERLEPDGAARLGASYRKGRQEGGVAATLLRETRCGGVARNEQFRAISRKREGREAGQHSPSSLRFW